MGGLLATVVSHEGSLVTTRAAKKLLNNELTTAQNGPATELTTA